MKYRVSLSLLFCFVLTTPAMPANASVKTSNAVNMHPASYAGMEEEILKYVNEYRKKKGLPALAMDAFMSGEAQKHSENMAVRRTSFGHAGFNTRIKRIGVHLNGATTAAENVAFGSTTAREVVDRWLKSPNHRQNIEGPYTVTGIGIATNKNGELYFTQIFASN